jgi:hypothetical protein
MKSEKLVDKEFLYMLACSDCYAEWGSKVLEDCDKICPNCGSNDVEFYIQVYKENNFKRLKLWVFCHPVYPTKLHGEIHILPQIDALYSNLKSEITIGINTAWLFWVVCFHLTIQKR